MNCKKCKRCGCFFVSDNEVCSKCEPKDNMELAKLRNYLSSNTVVSLEELSNNVGIAPANLNRFITSEEFTGVYKQLSKNSSDDGFNNISVSL